MVFERAQELGRLLGQSAEYKALVRADESLRANDQASSLLKELQRCEETVRSAVAQGHEPPQEIVTQYESTRESIERLTEFQGFIAAQANFDKLMQRVNEQIREGMEKGAASPIITLG